MAVHGGSRWPHSGQGVARSMLRRSYPHLGQRLFRRRSRVLTAASTRSSHGIPSIAATSQSGTLATWKTAWLPARWYQPRSPMRHSSSRVRCQRSSNESSRSAIAGRQIHADSGATSVAVDEPMGTTALSDSVSIASNRPRWRRTIRFVLCSSAIPDAGIGTHAWAVPDHPTDLQKLKIAAAPTLADAAIEAATRILLMRNVTSRQRLPVRHRVGTFECSHL